MGTAGYEVTKQGQRVKLPTFPLLHTSPSCAHSRGQNCRNGFQISHAAILEAALVISSNDWSIERVTSRGDGQHRGSFKPGASLISISQYRRFSVSCSALAFDCWAVAYTTHAQHVKTSRLCSHAKFSVHGPALQSHVHGARRAWMEKGLRPTSMTKATTPSEKMSMEGVCASSCTTSGETKPGDPSAPAGAIFRPL